MVVWGISSEGQGTLETFRDQMGLTFPILMDVGGEINAAYAQQVAFDTAAYPQDWVIGVDGEVAYVNNGYEPDEMIAVIEEQLAEQ